MACSPTSGARSGFGDGNGADDAGVVANEAGTSPSGTFDTTDAPDAGPPPAPCAPNPANYDIPGNGCDDDGDGTIDNPPTCDEALAVTGAAEDFAKALGICTNAADKGYGLVSATFTRGYQRTDAPQDEQHGILPKFGSGLKPREGKALGVLSSGYGREYDDSVDSTPFGGGGKTIHGKDWYDLATNHTANGSAPPGFPKASKGCIALSTKVNDTISLKLEVKAPPNANGLTFDFDFYSSEWPAWVCSTFNDSFIAYLTAKGFNGGVADNVSFDKDNNPVSVNNGFFDRCTANATTGCATNPFSSTTAACAGGTSELDGTGFGLHDSNGCLSFGSTTTTAGGATGWLTSQAPVQPGETFTIEFMVWDTGDALLDSSVLLDHFTWLGAPVTAPSTNRPK